MNGRTRGIILFALLLLMGGCSSVRTAFREGLPQPVVVQSFPGGAEVWINDVHYGATPVEVELGRKTPHKVVLRKPGYQTQTAYFVPEPNAREANYVKFGLLEDVGYYKELTPRQLAEILDHELVPTARAARPFEDMTRRILEADALLSEGRLDPLEHKVLSDKIIAFYRR